MKNITYEHRDGATVTYTTPVPGMEASSLWRRVEGPGYSRMRKPALVELCEQRSLDPEGTIPELADRLDAYDLEHRGDVAVVDGGQ